MEKTDQSEPKSALETLVLRARVAAGAAWGPDDEKEVRLVLREAARTLEALHREVQCREAERDKHERREVEVGMQRDEARRRHDLACTTIRSLSLENESLFVENLEFRKKILLLEKRIFEQRLR